MHICHPTLSSDPKSVVLRAVAVSVVVLAERMDECEFCCLCCLCGFQARADRLPIDLLAPIVRLLFL